MAQSSQKARLFPPTRLWTSTRAAASSAAASACLFDPSPLMRRALVKPAPARRSASRCRAISAYGGTEHLPHRGAGVSIANVRVSGKCLDEAHRVPSWFGNPHALDLVIAPAPLRPKPPARALLRRRGRPEATRARATARTKGQRISTAVSLRVFVNADVVGSGETASGPVVRGIARMTFATERAKGGMTCRYTSSTIANSRDAGSGRLTYSGGPVDTASMSPTLKGR